jgi:hypothetical protein
MCKRIGSCRNRKGDMMATTHQAFKSIGQSTRACQDFWGMALQADRSEGVVLWVA